MLKGIPAVDYAADELTFEQRAAIYKWYFDRALRTVGGSATIDQIHDRYSAAAVADTLFRHGDAKGSELIQDSINQVIKQLPEAERQRLGVGPLTVDGQMGVATFDTLKTLSNAGYGFALRDVLANKRLGATANQEQNRINHFRFPTGERPFYPSN